MRAALAIITALLGIGCSGQAAARPTPSSTPAATLSAGAAGCGSTAVLRGGIPDWLETAGGHNNPTSLRYVIGHPALVAGFLFSDPLRAGHPENPSNKVLWVVRMPRDGSPLTIDGHPLGATAPTVHETDRRIQAQARFTPTASMCPARDAGSLTCAGRTVMPRSSSITSPDSD